MALALKVSKVETIGGNYFVEYHTLTSGEAIAKAVTLANVPSDPTKVTLDPSEGCSQVYDTDFTVVGAELSWDGYGLETILEVGDKFRINYII